MDVRLRTGGIVAAVSLAAHAVWAGDSFAMQAAGAFDTALPRTHLIELQQGSDLSRKASALA
ncbi:MAG: hypothetical protein JNM97_03750 [Rhodoferax sp.]|jgi:hypothetical protein|nr:hypothetical protein [Rhodoferax sp.]